MNTIARRVRQLREQRGWDQEELAHRTGLSGSAISKLESSRHSPTIRTLERIANAFGVQLSALLVEDSEAARRRPVLCRVAA